MSLQKWIWQAVLVATVAVSVGARCDLNVLPTATESEDQSLSAESAVAAGEESVSGSVEAISKGRMEAARVIQPGSVLYVDLLQRDMAAADQHPCLPLGGTVAAVNFVPWPSRLGGAVLLPLAGVQPPIPASEYDVLITTPNLETEYVFSLRVITDPNAAAWGNFTNVEFNFRAVNPWVAETVGMPAALAHTPGNPYNMHEADYPSNDDNVGDRSLIDLRGGDVAIVIRGLQFVWAPDIMSTWAYMNNLGPQAWIAFMRDNAMQSGRFFALLGAWTGAPRAFSDTPGTADDGQFMSVQINGEMFDLLSEPFGNVNAVDPLHPVVCAGAAAQPYAFLDYSNVDVVGAPGAGLGGFVFVLRQDAFSTGPDPITRTPREVVLFPGALPSAAPNVNNMLPAPASGYNEPLFTRVFSPTETDHSGEITPGVHELSCSVLFMHQRR